MRSLCLKIWACLCRICLLTNDDRKVSLFINEASRTHCLNLTFPIQVYKKVNFLLDDFVFDRVEAHKKQHTHTQPGASLTHSVRMQNDVVSESPISLQSYSLAVSLYLADKWPKANLARLFLHGKLLINQLYTPGTSKSAHRSQNELVNKKHSDMCIKLIVKQGTWVKAEVLIFAVECLFHMPIST